MEAGDATMGRVANKLLQDVNQGAGDNVIRKARTTVGMLVVLLQPYGLKMTPRVAHCSASQRLARLGTGVLWGPNLVGVFCGLSLARYGKLGPLRPMESCRISCALKAVRTL
jgi:hypothetical protein